MYSDGNDISFLDHCHHLTYLDMPLFLELLERDKINPIVKIDNEFLLPAQCKFRKIDKQRPWSKNIGKNSSEHYSGEECDLEDGLYYLDSNDLQRLITHHPEMLLIEELTDDKFKFKSNADSFFMLGIGNNIHVVFLHKDEYIGILNATILLDINTPKNLDDWGKCIIELYIEYYNTNEHRPSSGQLWSHLFNFKQQDKWGINPIISKASPPHVSLAGIKLDRKSFEKRYNNYFTKHNPP